MGKRSCDLCGKRAVSWMCSGCKQVLCLDKDRSLDILKRLWHETDGPMLRQRFPSLDKMTRGNVPAYYNEVGDIQGQAIIAGMSCFHIAHPKHFCAPIDSDDRDSSGDQLAAVAASAVSSPAART